jgi:large subunit ribosomal protein L21
MAAIIEAGSKQFKVEEGSTILVDLMKGEPGDSVELDKVLAVIGDGPAVFGKPYVEGAKVQATLVAHTKGKKIIVFKYKPKKRIRTHTGHRQKYTELKIEKISV